MPLSIIREYRRSKIAAFSGVTAISLLLAPVLLIDIKNIEIKQMGSTQVSWQDATLSCNSLSEQWSLASIYQLAAIHYRRTDIELIAKTDYWSKTSIAGFAFGLNTARSIASFDRHLDTDHFLCVKPTPR